MGLSPLIRAHCRATQCPVSEADAPRFRTASTPEPDPVPRTTVRLPAEVRRRTAQPRSLGRGFAAACRIRARLGPGTMWEQAARMALPGLVRSLHPAPPAEVLDAADAADAPALPRFPHGCARGSGRRCVPRTTGFYVHDPDVRVARVQTVANVGPAGRNANNRYNQDHSITANARGREPVL